jgi:hypothetical protein
VAFVQIIEFSVENIDDVKALDQEWLAATEGKRTVRRQLIGADRDQPGHYVAILEFDSADDAAANADLPETLSYGERFFDLCTTAVHAWNLDVVDTYVAGASG